MTATPLNRCKAGKRCGKKVLPDDRGDVTIKDGQIPADARDRAGKGPARLADTGIGR